MEGQDKIQVAKGAAFLKTSISVNGGSGEEYAENALPPMVVNPVKKSSEYGLSKVDYRQILKRK